MPYLQVFQDVSESNYTGFLLVCQYNIYHGLLLYFILTGMSKGAKNILYSSLITYCNKEVVSIKYPNRCKIG